MPTEIDTLEDFVASVYRWLETCYTGSSNLTSPAEYPVIPIRPGLRQLAKEAWVEFSKDMPLHRLLERIRSVSAIAFQEFGLWGAQLRYKLATIAHASDMAFAGLSGWKKKLLDLIDNLLDSILKAIGVGEALKELKDALTDSLPENA